jgi:hypothetical protein
VAPCEHLLERRLDPRLGDVPGHALSLQRLAQAMPAEAVVLEAAAGIAGGERGIVEEPFAA